MTPTVREAINGRSSEPVIRKAAIQSGMVPLLEAARNKIRQGKTTPEEVMRVIQWVDEGKTSCPQCGKALSKKTRKCTNCESKLKPACTSCGQTLDPAWQVCPHCASPALLQEQQLPAKVKWGRRQTDNPGKAPDTLQ
jgi:predicted amidophosphoribosyltransferase